MHHALIRKARSGLQRWSQDPLNVQIGNNIIPAGPLSSRDNIEVGLLERFVGCLEGAYIHTYHVRSNTWKTFLGPKSLPAKPCSSESVLISKYS